MNFGKRRLLLFAAVSLALRGQEFEAASIKPSAPAEMGRMRVGIEMLPGGRVSMSGITVKILIQQAYDIRDFQVVGGPAWLSTERYDITAKPEGAASSEQVKLMTQALLADRFQLKFHRETKELTTYALVVAKGGPKMKVSDAPVEENPEGGRGRGGGRMMMQRGHFEAEGAPIPALVNYLANALGRSVSDKTGLTGNYDFKLDWTPDEPSRDEHPSDAAGPSIFTAVQDQLGLKLESAKAPVEILVIDSAAKASAN